MEEDVEWLASYSPLFSELLQYGAQKTTEYFNLCRTSPKMVAAATVKAAQQPKVIQAAIADMARQTVPAVGNMPEGDAEMHACSFAGCSKEYLEYNKLQMHMAAAHGTASEMSRKVPTEFCPICLLRFSCRGAVLGHLGKNKMCFLNVQRFAYLEDATVVAMLEGDCEARAVNTKAGVHREFADKTAVRMLGPYRVQCPDGSMHCVRNGHPLSLNHPWRKNLYFTGSGDGSRQLPNKPCIAACFMPCTSLCGLCLGIR